MSDETTKTTTAIALPEKLILQHEDPKASEAYAQEQAQAKKLRAVMMLDKAKQEEIIRATEPVLEEAQHKFSEVHKKLIKAGEKAVSDLKVSEEFADVKKALRALKINSIECSIEFGSVNLNGRGKIEFRRTVGKRSDSYYSNTTMSGEDYLPFTEEMTELLKEYRTLDKQVKDLTKQIADAQSKLRDRANRMSDAEGALALRSMSAEEMEEVKGIYEQLTTGVTAAGLLGG